MEPSVTHTPEGLVGNVERLSAQKCGRFSLLSVLRHGFGDGPIFLASGSLSESLEEVARLLVMKMPEVILEQRELASAVLAEPSLLPRVVRAWRVKAIAQRELSDRYAEDMGEAVTALINLGFVDFQQGSSYVPGTPEGYSGVYYHRSFCLTTKGSAALASDQDNPLNTTF